MSDEFDIEDVLKRYRSDPSPQTKQSVLAEFHRTQRRGGSSRDEAGFWKKPVPLYMAIAVFFVAVGLSFAAGQRASRMDDRPGMSRESLPAGHIITSQDIEWATAENDLL